MTQDNHSLNTEQQSRRQLLKMTAYIPPALLGVMVASNTAEAATIKCGGVTYTVSAGGIACCPCVTTPTSRQCLQNQCQLGNCTSCVALGRKRCRRTAPASCRQLCP